MKISGPICKDYKRTSKKGFTLIELLVVIAIIGLLASIILASLNTARQKGRDARRLSDIKQIQLALELYFESNSNVYPPTIGGNTIVPSYISVLPTDPVITPACSLGSEAGCYAYMPLVGAATVNSTCGAYHLGADLEQSSNSALTGDAAGTTGGTYNQGSSDGTPCNVTVVNNTNGQDFNALPTGPCMQGTQTQGPTYCYDVKP